MSTGHTTYTTFHADTVGEVLKRFTTEPINVSKTMFTALDLVSVQTSTRVQGKKVRRNKSLTEINHYDAENDEINVQDVFQWQAETDEFLQMGDSNTLEDIMFDRGWSRETLNEELRKRRVVLAYLIDRGLNSYAQVAATFQAFINDPETVLALMANEQLERSLEDLREMESVLINVDREKEEMVPRPEPDEAGREEVERILADADDLFAEYRGRMPDSVADALLDVAPAADVEASPDDDHETLAARLRERPDVGAGSDGPAENGATGDGPAENGVRAGVTDDAGVEAAPEAGSPPSRPLDADDSEGVSDADTGDGAIDFDEPFDEGINVLDSAAEEGETTEPAPTEAAESPPDDSRPDDPRPEDSGFESPEVDDVGRDGSTANGETDADVNDESEDGSDSEDEADAEDEAGSEHEADSEDGADADGQADSGDGGETDDDDIGDWGFGTVESPEER
jgi:flagellar protein FlaI